MTTEIEAAAQQAAGSAAEAAPKPATPPSSTIMSVQMGWRSAVFQAALVVLGVVLSMAVTQWQTDAAQQAEAHHALDGIMEELSANHAAVKEARAYHDEKLVILAEAQKASTPLDIRSFDRGFVSPAQLSNAAWTSASEVGALAHLPFDKVLALSKVYSAQASYMQQQITAGNIIYGQIFAEGSQGMLNHGPGLRSLIATFQYREQQLETAYATALGKHTATMPEDVR